MRDIKIKLSSNYQQIEFTVENLNDAEISAAVELINRLGANVNNSDAPGKTAGKTANKAPKQAPAAEPEEPATENQVKYLEKFGIDATLFTRRQAWTKIRDLKK